MTEASIWLFAAKTGARFAETLHRPSNGTLPVEISGMFCIISMASMFGLVAVNVL